MGLDAEILWPTDDLDNPGLPIHQQIQRILVDTIPEARLGTAASAILQQFAGNMPDAQAASTVWQLPLAQAHLSHVAPICVADEASAGPLLFKLRCQQRYGAAQHAWQMPDFDSIGWYGQARASLAAAMVLGKLRH